MPDFITHASFVIRCDSRQRALAIKAFSHIQNGVYSEKAIMAITNPENVELSNEENLIRFWIMRHPDFDAKEPTDALPWDFVVDPSDEGILVRNGLTINTSQAAVFTQGILLAFELEDLIVIEATHEPISSSEQVFGGHVVAVTSQYIRWQSTVDFVSREKTAHDHRVRYFIGSSDITDPASLSPKFLVSMDEFEDAEYKLNEIRSKVFGKDDEYENGSQDEFSIKNFHEISPHDFEVLKIHLPVF
jgi:hypothetical protein